jgi:hypothetical protein
MTEQWYCSSSSSTHKTFSDSVPSAKCPLQARPLLLLDSSRTNLHPFHWSGAAAATISVVGVYCLGLLRIQGSVSTSVSMTGEVFISLQFWHLKHTMVCTWGSFFYSGAASQSGSQFTWASVLPRSARIHGSELVLNRQWMNWVQNRW